MKEAAQGSGNGWAEAVADGDVEKQTVNVDGAQAVAVGCFFLDCSKITTVGFFKRKFSHLQPTNRK